MPDCQEIAQENAMVCGFQNTPRLIHNSFLCKEQTVIASIAYFFGIPCKIMPISFMDDSSFENGWRIFRLPLAETIVPLFPEPVNRDNRSIPLFMTISPFLLFKGASENSG
ncbi:MAG: hypothetical protein LBL45_05970 [Treponema sp.]|jgi:hypothetical protein|nr:hypothetical protein [Treponema sp.]